MPGGFAISFLFKDGILGYVGKGDALLVRQLVESWLEGFFFSSTFLGLMGLLL
jgi:hypothetical protein